MMGGGGTTTMPRSRIGRLNPDGSLDASFDPGANGFVLAVTLQVDGKILVGGGFTMLGGGGTGTTTRAYLGRLDADGSLDTTFDPASNSYVYAVPVQPDGKILVGGNFTALGRGSRCRRATTSPGSTATARSTPPSIRARTIRVYAIAVQPDGKILLGGCSRHSARRSALTRNRIARLNADGSLDAALIQARTAACSRWRCSRMGRFWSAGASPRWAAAELGMTPRNISAGSTPTARSTTASIPVRTSVVYALAVQPDGKILVGGDFTMLGGGGPADARQHWRGSTRTARSTPASIRARTATSTPWPCRPDGKILVGGAFTMLGGGGTGTTPRNYIGRLNADGSLDTSFDPGANDAIVSMAVQPDGKILVGGGFTTLGGGTGTTTRNRIGRLNADGSLDISFNPGANDVVDAMALQADGKILVGGVFTALGGGDRHDARNRIGRLNRRRLARRQLQSRRERLRLRPGAAGGREGPGRRRLHDARRRRDRHDAARPASGG